jgi:phosphoglycerate kinase
MGLPVNTTPDCIGHEVEEKVKKLKEGDILVLENLRFHPEEEENDVGFAQKLASLADIYVDDAFSTAHRDHASIVGVAKYLPAVAGFLMQKELEVMGKLLHNPERPWACLIGGAKGNDKIELLQNMLTKVDILLVGGGIAATFLKTQGYEVGNSLIDNSKLGLAKGLLQEAKELRVPFLLPIDSVVAQEVRAGASTRIVPITDIPTDHHIVDIGPKSNAVPSYGTAQWGSMKCLSLLTVPRL